MASHFIHLHTHSHYSLLNALPKIPDLVSRAKQCGMSALALTDNGNLYGAIEFYKECKKEGIKPIIGVDAYLAIRTRHDKEVKIDSRRHRLVLLAKNDAGYRNLLKLVTYSNFEGFYYKPRMDKELLQKYADGLIAISPSFSGDIASALKNADEEKARSLLYWYWDAFGKENVFLEVTHHPEIEKHEMQMDKVKKFSGKEGAALVAAHDVYYLDPDDRKARRTLMSVQQNAAVLSDEKLSDMDDFSFIDMKRASEIFKDERYALENTLKIADVCNLSLVLGKWVFPDYKTVSGKSYDEELRDKTYAGLTRRNIALISEVKTRIEYELDVIREKGYAPYFLIVSDLLDYAHQNGILTTIRGSVAGSLVTYLAGITNVDPLEYKLPFERFLNRERPSAPDIDMDFADNRRDEVIEYAKKKYGGNKVAQIGTFGTMMARGAVRDVARALGYEYEVGDRISKLIPLGAQGFPMSIDKALELVPELRMMYKDEKETKEIIDMAKKIEGCARHISVHAAGVVISPKPLVEYAPLQLDPKGEGKTITQYDMYAITDEYGGVGLLKFDFLGIRNLAILADAVERVKIMEGKAIDIENIPLNNKKTFEILSRGETIGLFQLNGAGMTRFLKELRPTSIHDINAMVALYRPGPIETIPQYIERKHNPQLVTHIDPRMKDILEHSHGVITYQDDVLLIAIQLAGYSWLEADKLRKAMGKKIPKEMEAQKEKLISGFIKNGLTKMKADDLWKLIEPFAAYGFNKAHAASYGKVAYQTAYMKANFPAIYMASVLTAESGDVEKIGEIITECSRMGIAVLPPSVNESMSGFTVVRKEGAPDQIRFGLTTIKNFGEGIANVIIKERERAGRFTSLSNFLERIKSRNFNKKSLEALIMAGALDEFGERGLMRGNIDRILIFIKEADRNEHQTSLFGVTPGGASALGLYEAAPATSAEKLAWEKELLGLYISGHPLDKWRNVLAKLEVNIRRAKEEYKDGMIVVLGGLVEEVKTIMTKNNQAMCFGKLSDLSGSIEVVFFPRIYVEYKTLLIPESTIAVKGRISSRNNTPSLIAEKVKKLE